MLAVGVERDDDLDSEPLGDQVAGLECGPLAAVDRVCHDVGAVRHRDAPRTVPRRIVDDEDPGRAPGDRLGDLGQDAGQRFRLVVGRDHDEDAAGVLADLVLLELRRRQRPDQPPDPLRLALGLGKDEEDQQVGEHHGEDEDRDDPADRLVAEADEVLDGADDVRRDRDPEEPEADEQQRQDDRPVRIPTGRGR